MWCSLMSGAHHQESAIAPFSSHCVFTDRSIFSLSLLRIPTPIGTSVTDRKHGLNFNIILPEDWKEKQLLFPALTYFAGKEA